MELHPSFYQIIRKHRNDPKVSDDQFIAALTSALTKNKTNIQKCGHGTNYTKNNQCLVCLTINQEEK